MKAVVIHKFVTDLDKVHPSDVDPPPVTNDQVVIDVKAAGVNFVDTLYAQGKHQNNRNLVTPPFTLGLEFSGVVRSVPPTTTTSPSPFPFPPGTPVFGDAPSGSYATQLSLPASASLHAIPRGWTFADAAGVAATLPVAYGALVLRGRLSAGETVLVLGAAGGLGVAAVQVAAAAAGRGGCRVIGVAGGAGRCAVVRGLGAGVRCVDRLAGRGQWWEAVMEETGGRGVDVVFDPVGLVGLSLKCLAHRGRILVVGFAGRDAASMEGVMMNRVLLKQAELIGYRFGESHRRYPGEKEQIWRELWPLIEAGKIKPVLYDEKYMGLESVPRALKDIASGKIWGKAVVHVDTAEEEGQKARL
ncbi:hypothetical protein QBC33DRAFT_587678 [Phialemonium atrogriseum]|uniref:Enoyl reductase (ER) domain-containing protein n=1 Tax=Phialemonium atrogriseum TaxID=1093897 RepID=A0AAJ0FH25_9PEZI|nr:uncharacterized protein QBC33DRAFT_587678 [Phialemonium atrogriseum]KAK1767232.1 hypothetical protein QBC33DRAFT_587678 [Phialemonium atrogriseum]